jgi:two-component system, LuxR family, sensor kinase FixL
MDAAAGISPAGRWLERSAPATYQRALIWIVALSLAYYATAVAVYARLMMPSLPSVAVLWPPNVLLFVAFLLAPVRLWPLVIAFALPTQLAVAATMDIPLGRSLGMFTGNLSQPIIAAAILRRFGQGERMLETLRGATAFILVAALGAPAIASAVSAATLSATGWITDPLLHWRMRFVTNVLSTIVLAPPLLTFLRWRSLPHPLGPPVAEFLILLTCLTASERLVNSLVTSVSFYPLLFAPLPFLLWAAVRFGQAGLGIVLCFTALFRFLANAHPGQALVTPQDAIVATQLTLIAISLPLMVLAALLSERRSSEQALRDGHSRYGLATIAGNVGVWDWNLVTNAIYVDPSLKNILGFADHEIANHLDDWGLRVHPDDGERVMAAAQAHIDGRVPAFEAAHRMVHRDGSIRWFLARGAVVDRQDGRAIRMIGTDTDITAQKDAEQALEEAKAELARLTRLTDMGGLTAAIAHEVNQPLCAIVANASAALRWLGSDQPDISQVREALTDVVCDGKRASELIRRTRGLFERGELERRSVDLNNIVHSALALTRGSLEATRVSVRTQLDTALPLVRADQVQLQQVFCNLIINASEAMTRVTCREHTMQISTCHQEGSGIYATVMDSGEGFNGDDPERVFRPLVTTRPEGMGIGLSMSRIIVEMHGGRLWATPNEGPGATFHILLPLGEFHG